MNRGVFPGGNSSWRPPLFTLGKFPIHVTGLIVLLQIVGMLAVVVSQGKLLPWVDFIPKTILEGHVWRFATYAFFEIPTIWFVIGCVFFFRFGSQVEHSIGRKSFVLLCVSLLLAGPAIIMVSSFVGLGSAELSGSWIPHSSIFMAFCAMYPNCLLYTSDAADE